MFYNPRRYAEYAVYPYPLYHNPYYGSMYPPVYPTYHDFTTLKQERNYAVKDCGPHPFVINIEAATQMTVMSINAGEDIGLEIHPGTDQFIRIEEGQGLVQMGDHRDQLDYRVTANAGDAILIPAGKWHNLTNTGTIPLKVYVIYAPPEHPYGTVHETKADAMANRREL